MKKVRLKRWQKSNKPLEIRIFFVRKLDLASFDSVKAFAAKIKAGK